MAQPLDGVRVLDLTHVLAGPYCTMVLGDLGAEVIKVERPPIGDDSRRMSPFLHGESLCFLQVNRNKRSLVLDLSSPEGHEILMSLAAQSDVLVENFRPGTTERLGCDYEAIKTVSPDIVYCSISGFGQTGPDARRAGYDIIAQGISGLLSMTGHPGSPPAKVGIALHDIAGGVTAVQAILAAHIARLGGHGGQHVDVSLIESGIAWTVWEAAAFFGSGEIPAAEGTRHRRSAPYQAFRTADGYMTIGANTDRMWQALCSKVLDRPEWATLPKYASALDRLANVAELERDIESVVTTRSTEHWIQAMTEVGIAAGPVNDYAQMLQDPHLRARNVTTTVEHDVLGRVDALSSPLRLSKTPTSMRRAAPMLGQHSVEILSELGVGAVEIADLIKRNVIIDASEPLQAATEEPT